MTFLRFRDSHRKTPEESDDEREGLFNRGFDGVLSINLMEKSINLMENRVKQA